MEEKIYLSGSNSLCETHKRTKLSFASLLLNNASPFYCSVCLMKNKQNDHFISIEEILITDNAVPIKNWPAQLDNSSYEFLAFKQTATLKESISKEIIQFYDKMKTDICLILHESEKKQLHELDQIQIGSDEEMNLYNNLFKRNDLINIFKYKTDFSKENYQKLIESVDQTSKQDLQQLMNNIKEKKQHETQFQEFQQQQVLDLSNNITSKIQELSSLLLFDKRDFTNNQSLDQVIQCQEKNDKNELEFKHKKRLIDIQMKLNILENKSQFLLEESHPKIDINYLEAKIIQISNPHRQSGRVEPIFFNTLNSKLNFKLHFDSLDALKGFKLKIFIVAESNKLEFNIEEPLQNLFEYFKKEKPKYMSFKVLFNLTSNIVQLSSGDFNQRQTIDFAQTDKTSYSFCFDLDKNCDEFTITEFKPYE